jgi:hypothetical protein
MRMPVFLAAARLGKQRVVRRRHRLHLRRFQHEADHRRLQHQLGQALLQQAHQVLVAPGRFGQRDLDRGRRPRHLAPLVFELQHDALDRQLVRAQPARQLQQQAVRAEQQRFGVFDAVEQFEPGAETGGRLHPFVQLGTPCRRRRRAGRAAPGRSAAAGRDAAGAASRPA